MHDFTRLVKKAGKKANDAADPVAVCFGIVTKESPLEVTVEQRLLLTREDLILTRAVMEHELEWTPGNLIAEDEWEFPEVNRWRYKVHNKLEKDDKLILLRVQGGQKYIVMDKEWVKDDTIKQQ